MATITGLTADRMLAIEAASVVDGDVVGDNLILTQYGGAQINAGSVRGPAGPAGPIGSDQAILTAAPILDVGMTGQIRAGRQLTLADFTNLGLSPPIGLWNLSDLSDVSGHGRNLMSKGSLPFGVGINGLANTAAQYNGAPSQGLYISDIGGANDPFRIKTGSMGCWFRTGNRDTEEVLCSKFLPTGNQRGYIFEVYQSAVWWCISLDGGPPINVYGISDACDNRWHHAVGTHDGIVARLYVDGILENSMHVSGPIFGSYAPFNIGSAQADASTAAAAPFFGRIDEFFITNDVLSEDQIRNLYCAKIPHTLGAVPSRVSLNVRRRIKGAALVASDFPTQPLRLYNFSGGSLGDEGSNGVSLNNAGAASVPGVDGSNGNAFALSGQWMSATDAGLPSGSVARSYGCWLKTTWAGNYAGILAWGTLGSGEARLDLDTSIPTKVRSISSEAIIGPPIGDGIWHFIVVTEDNIGTDGVSRKLFVDGRLIGQSKASIASIVLGGANHFRIGSNSDGSFPLSSSQVDAVFVCGYTLTPEQIVKLYTKSLITFAPSPKNAGDHVEVLASNSLLATFDTLEMQHAIDLTVAA